MKTLKIAALAALLTFAGPAAAYEVSGVRLPDTVEQGRELLLLNGAGVRTRLIVDVYVGSLYLATKTSSAAAVKPPARMRLDLLREVDAAAIGDAIADGFGAKAEPLKDELARLRAMLEPLAKGDVVVFDFTPDGRTRVQVKGRDKGAIAGADFQRALLEVWLGDKPVDAKLKQKLLGQ